MLFTLIYKLVESTNLQYKVNCFDISFPTILINHFSAFSRMGFNVSPAFVATAVWRYDIHRRQQLCFEDFICCCLLVQSLTAQFKQKDTAMTGNAQISYDDFMCIAVANVRP